MISRKTRKLVSFLFWSSFLCFVRVLFSSIFTFLQTKTKNSFHLVDLDTKKQFSPLFVFFIFSFFSFLRFYKNKRKLMAEVLRSSKPFLIKVYILYIVPSFFCLHSENVFFFHPRILCLLSKCKTITGTIWELNVTASHTVQGLKQLVAQLAEVGPESIL